MDKDTDYKSFLVRSYTFNYILSLIFLSTGILCKKPEIIAMAIGIQMSMFIFVVFIHMKCAEMKNKR